MSLRTFVCLLHYIFLVPRTVPDTLNNVECINEGTFLPRLETAVLLRILKARSDVGGQRSRSIKNVGESRVKCPGET